MNRTLKFTLLLLACSSDGPSDPVPDPFDPTPPELAIVFPVADVYDRDSDGLVDLEIAFRDSGVGIDSASVEISASRPLGPNGTGGKDLMTGLEIIEVTGDRIVLEERADALLPRGVTEIIVTARDRANNVSEARRAVNLPAGHLHAVLQFPANAIIERTGLVMLPDGSRGFILTDDGLVPFDPWTLELGSVIPSPRGLLEGVYDPSTRRIYFTGAFGLIGVFDPVAEMFELPIQTTGQGLRILRGPSGLLYVALVAPTASVGVVDPVSRAEIRVVDTGLGNDDPTRDTYVFWVWIPPQPDLLYVGLGITEPQDVIVVDRTTGSIVTSIELKPDDPNTASVNLDRVFDVNRRRLYVTDFLALAEIDIDRNVLGRRLNAPGMSTKFLELSPSGNRLFVSLGSSFLPPESWLVDVGTFSILERFSTDTGENDSAFRSDGQLVFSLRKDALAVYLNREP